MQEYTSYDGVGLGRLIANGEVSSLELVQAMIARIQKLNPTLNCISVKDYDVALSQAKQYKPGSADTDSPFAGLPWLMKNLTLMYEGTSTTNSLRPLNEIPAPHNSYLIEKARKAGLLLVGKTAVPENGFCISCESPLHGVMRNSWNQDHIGGGSSGGAGVAVGSRIAPFAHSSDGAGSTRIPASFNGAFGMKATRGASSYAPDFADIWYGGAVEGCISISVRDSAAYYDIILGGQPGELYNFQKPETPYLAEVNKDPGRLRIGYCLGNKTGMPVDAECIQAVMDTVQLLTDLGHNVEEFTFEHSSDELAENFSDLAAVCAAFGRQGIDNALARTTTAGEYTRVNWELAEKGLQTSGLKHCADVEKFHLLGRSIAIQCNQYDVVLTPTMPTPPVRIGSYNMETALEDYLPLLSQQLMFTLPYSASGQPAMSVPLHWTKNGLPVGVQFAAGLNEESLLFRLASQLEKAKPWADQWPDIAR